MTLQQELSRLLPATAMSGAAIVEWWLARARCVRCRHLDADESRCMVGEICGMFVENPAEFGCVNYED